MDGQITDHGRTTLTSLIPGGQGVDLNRAWSASFSVNYSNRNNTGDKPFLAYEARYLRDFLLKNKSKTGKNVLVDLHGWTQQLIGDSYISGYYKDYFKENSYVSTYGRGYLINWARQNLGNSNFSARSCLIELPSYIRDSNDVDRYDLKNKYINATLNMLRGM